MRRAIFISYRRSDTQGEAGRLSDVLSHRFGEHSVFMDVDAIQPGRDFRKAIEESVQNCTVLLAVLGPDWLHAQNARGGRRLDEPSDYVRLEIAAALRRVIPVIPLLIRGAKVPFEEELPPDVSDLAFRNGLELSHARWKSDLEVLIGAIQPYMAEEGTVSSSSRVGASSPPNEAVAPTALPISGTTNAPLRTGHKSSTLQSASIEKVSKVLAHYIGPIAELVVKRAARECDSVPALCAAVSKEIESAADRTNFLRQCDK